MRSRLSSRCQEIELLDAGPGPGQDIRRNLRDLRFYNAWFGGARRLVREVQAILPEEPCDDPLTVLDVGTGSADIPARLVRWGRARGMGIHAGGVDTNPRILSEARRHLDREGASVSLIRADARHLPVPDGGVDLAICSNFLHHLDSPSAREVIGELVRVSRLGIVVVDLTRSRAALGIVWLLTRLTSRDPITRNDGVLSVRRAFTARELRDLAVEAGLAGARVRRVGPVRMVLSQRLGDPRRARRP